MLGTSVQTFSLLGWKLQTSGKRGFLLSERENSFPEYVFGKLYQQILINGFITINSAGKLSHGERVL